MVKQNCWEFKKCEKYSGGAKEKELGGCPACTAVKATTLHGGKNGGRVCWVIAGTFCAGQKQGTYSEKIYDCVNCDFYKNVRREEGKEFMFVTEILKKIGSKE